MSKSRANVLLIFQCPCICLTPLQVNILVSDDSLAFCPSMFNRCFYLDRDQSQIRIRNEVCTVKHVEALQFFFLLAQILSIIFLSVKTWPLPLLCVCVCVLLVVVVGESRRYNHSNIYHDPAIGYIITCVDRCWRVGQWLQMHFTLTTRVGICVR